MKKIIITFIALAVFSSFLIPTAFAQTSSGDSPRKLEIEYPAFTTTPPPTEETTLPNYVKYIYYFIIMTSGIVALVVLVIGGVQYIASTGNPTKLNDAKERISSALIGLFILLCSGLILRAINPTIVVFKSPEEPYPIFPEITPGVYLCKERVNIPGFWQMRQNSENSQDKETARQMNEILEQVAGKCLLLSSSGNISQEFDGKVKFVYLVPLEKELSYGVIVYQESGFGGKASVIFGDTQGGIGNATQATEWGLPGSMSPSSARPFTLIDDPPSGYKVTMYELVHFNRDDKENKKEKKECQVSKTSQNCSVTKEIGSVEIEGNVFVIFFKDQSSSWTLETEIDVVTSPGDNNLNDNLMGKWKPNECVERREPDWRDRYYPCAASAKAISANFY
jgi:hypothetical protein